MLFIWPYDLFMVFLASLGAKQTVKTKCFMENICMNIQINFNNTRESKMKIKMIKCFVWTVTVKQYYSESQCLGITLINHPQPSPCAIYTLILWLKQNFFLETVCCSTPHTPTAFPESESFLSRNALKINLYFNLIFKVALNGWHHLNVSMNRTVTPKAYEIRLAKFTTLLKTGWFSWAAPAVNIYYSK